jgi:hypothetical protein
VTAGISWTNHPLPVLLRRAERAGRKYPYHSLTRRSCYGRKPKFVIIRLKGDSTKSRTLSENSRHLSCNVTLSRLSAKLDIELIWNGRCLIEKVIIPSFFK